MIQFVYSGEYHGLGNALERPGGYVPFATFEDRLDWYALCTLHAQIYSLGDKYSVLGMQRRAGTRSWLISLHQKEIAQAASQNHL